MIIQIVCINFFQRNGALFVANQNRFSAKPARCRWVRCAANRRRRTCDRRRSRAGGCREPRPKRVPSAPAVRWYG
jgi:hypothetical protein